MPCHDHGGGRSRGIWIGSEEWGCTLKRANYLLLAAKSTLTSSSLKEKLLLPRMGYSWKVNQGSMAVVLWQYWSFGILCRCIAGCFFGSLGENWPGDPSFVQKWPIPRRGSSMLLVGIFRNRNGGWQENSWKDRHSEEHCLKKCCWILHGSFRWQSIQEEDVEACKWVEFH